MVEEISPHPNFGVKLCCNTLDVSRSGYYDWVDRPASESELKNEALLPRIRAVHEKSDQTYGSPRITHELRSEGLECSENRVARLMNENAVVSDAVKKFKVTTTDSNHDLPIADRIFETENVWRPNQVFAGDINYVATEKGFLFLAIFLDIFTRKVVGLSADDNKRTQLVLTALGMALKQRDVIHDEVIAHTDRGLQYASDDYRAKLELVGITASMSRRGNCWDNAHRESFSHSLKTGLVYRRKFKTRKAAKDGSLTGPRPGTTDSDGIPQLNTCRQLITKS